MWKNFFFFSRGQRIGVITLISLIIIVFTVNFLLSKFFKNETKFDREFSEQGEVFLANLQSLDSLRQIAWQQQYEERYKNRHTNIYKKISIPKTYTLFTFDPNTLDSAGFVHLGLKTWQISNILKYRNRGGKYHTKDDFAKLYGLTQEKFLELSSYISITQNIEKEELTIKNKETESTVVLVELNAVDTAELVQIRGIGAATARNILRYREYLGGFTTLEQLLEVKGMRAENYEKIKPFFQVNMQSIRKIKVNSANIDKLRSHPYINFYQAQAIYELRRKCGKLNNLEELRETKNFPDEFFQKMEPYLDFK